MDKKGFIAHPFFLTFIALLIGVVLGVLMMKGTINVPIDFLHC